MFAKKLDFIMNLTNSHNIELARAIDVDASSISRLRTGKRPLPKAQSFLPDMCTYFARRMTDDYQKKTAAAAICPGESFPEDTERAAELLCSWLAQGNETQMGSVELLLNSVSTLRFPSSPAAVTVEPISISPANRLYYGLEGIQKAVLDLFDIALVSGVKRNIYLFSDENANWMGGDEQFLQDWISRLKRLIIIGCEVKIIHNTARALDDLMNSLSKWLPLYLTGSVEPYYYPNIRDGVFHRTLFIAEGLAALQSSSIDGFESGALIHLLTEPEGVTALTTEFFSYFSLCRPFVEIVFDSSEYLQLLKEHDRTTGSYFLCGISPSLFSMPRRVAERISYRSGSDALLEYLKNLEGVDSSLYEKRELCELISIPTDQQIYEDAIPVAIAPLLGIKNCYYTAQEYALHLNKVMELARSHRNYRFALTNSIPQNTFIYCKNSEWAVISKCSLPCISFAFEHPAAVGAVRVFLQELYDSAQTSYSLKSTLAELMLKLK